jgi:hypothetical protein
MDSMLEEVEEALTLAADLPPTAVGLDQARAELDRQMGLYRRERDAIRKAKSAGPGAWEAHRLNTWARLVGARYRRHFAGHSRLTRDVALLAEIRSDTARLKAEVESAVDSGKVGPEAIASAREALTKDHKLYGSEIDQIRQARDEALETEPNRLASALANIANNQFALYKAQFAGKNRTSRRPALLERMIGALEVTQTRMVSLRDGGLESKSNTRNVDIIEGRLRAWRAELGEVQTAKKDTALSELVGALGGAANDLFEAYRAEYAGHSRATRELDPLAAVCDGLYDLARQMDEIDRMIADPTNRQNLGVVLENLRMYESEWDAIRSARRQ